MSLCVVTYAGPSPEHAIHRLGIFVAGVPREVDLTPEQAEALKRKAGFTVAAKRATKPGKEE